MSIIAVFNQKGGVGKTTTAVNLAAALSRIGRSTYGIDLDPQAQLSSITNVIAKSGVDTVLSLFQSNRPLCQLVRESASRIKVIPAHTELAKVDALYGKGFNVVNKLNSALQTERFGGRDNPVVIDCNPMVGVLSLNAIFSCTGLIVPISADHLSTKGALQIEKTLTALEQVLKRRVNRRYLLTRFDGRRRMAWDVLKLVEEHFGADVCRTRISENVSLAESPAMNKTVFEHAPDSRGAHDYDDLLKELLADGFIE
ncbi:ParA family protein [Sideroxydans lithotrophicus]|uniref:Cobyrinic acid ac-diamide synthase n=1 Tax=Sideroxydans lithotrophicus (strain ES-1) TaxID=580332 RepID=D5CRT1_SIDLE|nr:ParA family protein [Sideroxydans lithotrophicus]ADE11667.1 Cobyrinic acid ac-diamide synthase [Sideroxydans lithotrophicus ES-1]